MGFTNIKSNKGFTIVELLIVVVVIAILAAITIVSYNGITTKAKDSSAKAAASSIQKKAELYFAEHGNYPATVSQFAAAGKAYDLPSTAFTASNGVPTNSDEKVAQWSPCGTASGSPSGHTGARVVYWEFGRTTPGTNNTIVVGSGC